MELAIITGDVYLVIRNVGTSFGKLISYGY